MKKKVLLVGPAWPLRGGLATFDERLCKAFEENGCECEILSFKLQYPEFLFPGTTQYSSDPAPEAITIYTKLNSINPLNWLFMGLKFRRKKYDLIVFRFWMPFMGPCLGMVARLLRRKGKTRIVAITDNLIPHEKRFGDKFLTKWFIGGCDGLVTMSRSVLNDIETYFPGKPAQYNPHPMYDTFGQPISREEALKSLGLDPAFRYMLFFGFIRRYKGLDLLLEAIADPRFEELPLKFIIAGEYYEDKQPYLEMIEKYSLHDKLILKTDFIPNSQVSQYFCAADMVVQPYHNATQSGVTQVAYYYNIPMLVTDVGGLAELVPHQEVGYVVQPNAQAVADAILDFVNNNRHQQFVAGVKKYREQFTWNSLIEKLWFK
ncbi:MAG: glycosyltransferase [Flavobacteriaceae bacterium]|nr:glycosyltransferase [Flavobacteriaceae bacterium]